MGTHVNRGKVVMSSNNLEGSTAAVRFAVLVPVSLAFGRACLLEDIPPVGLQLCTVFPVEVFPFRVGSLAAV